MNSSSSSNYSPNPRSCWLHLSSVSVSECSCSSFAAGVMLSSQVPTVLQVSIYQHNSRRNFKHAREERSHLRCSSPVTKPGYQTHCFQLRVVVCTTARGCPLHNTRNITTMHPSIFEECPPISWIAFLKHQLPHLFGKSHSGKSRERAIAASSIVRSTTTPHQRPVGDARWACLDQELHQGFMTRATESSVDFESFAGTCLSEHIPGRFRANPL